VQRRDQDRRDHEGGRVQRESRAGPDQRDQPAGDRRADDLDEATGRPGDRVSRQPLLLGRERRDHGLDGRDEEGDAGGEPGRDDVGVPGALRPQEREDERGAEEVGTDQDGLPAEPVDDDPRDGTEPEHRHDLGRNQASHREPPAGQPEDQDDQGDVVQRVAEAREELPQPQGDVRPAADHATVGRDDPRQPRRRPRHRHRHSGPCRRSSLVPQRRCGSRLTSEPPRRRGLSRRTPWRVETSRTSPRSRSGRRAWWSSP
jgi:hypothetical protein